MSQFIQAYQLQSIIRNSSKRFTIIDNESGQIFTGNNVNVDKCTPLQVKMAGKNHNSFDTNGLMEFLNTSSWVSAPGAAFKNWWDSHALKQPKKPGKFTSLWYALITVVPYENLEFATEIISGSNYQYISCRVKGKKNITAFFNKSGKLRFFRLENGEEIPA